METKSKAMLIGASRNQWSSERDGERRSGVTVSLAMLTEFAAESEERKNMGSAVMSENVGGENADRVWERVVSGGGLDMSPAKPLEVELTYRISNRGPDRKVFLTLVDLEVVAVPAVASSNARAGASSPATKTKD